VVQNGEGIEGIVMVFSPVVEDDGDGRISGLTAPVVELGVAKSLATWASKGSGECAQEAKEEQRDAWKCSPALGRCSVGRNFAGGRPLWRWPAAGPHSGGSAPVCLRRLGAAEEVRLGKTKPVVASARSGINGGSRTCWNIWPKQCDVHSIGLQYIGPLPYRKVNVVWRECKGGLVPPCYSMEMRTNI
jgi:hypothetical protein